MKNLKELHAKINEEKAKIMEKFPLYFSMINGLNCSVGADIMYDNPPKRIKIFDIAIDAPYHVDNSIETVFLRGCNKDLNKDYVFHMYMNKLGSARANASMLYGGCSGVNYPIIGRYYLDGWIYCSYPNPYALIKLAQKNQDLAIKKFQNFFVSKPKLLAVDNIIEYLLEET